MNLETNPENQPSNLSRDKITDVRYRYHLQLVMMILLLTVTLILLCITNIIIQENRMMVITFIGLLVSTALLMFTLRTDAFDRYLPWIFTAFVCALVIPYYVLCGNEWIYIYWMSFLPVLLITTLGMTVGQTGSMILLLISVIFFYTPLQDILPSAVPFEEAWVYRMAFIITEIMADFLGAGVCFLNTVIIRQLSRLESNFCRQARQDSLTGLSNQMAFTEFVSNIHKQFTDQDELDMMFIDVDNFKHINDTYGHIVGNQLLQQIAGVLDKDKHLVTARWGGDEFVVLEKNMPRDVFIATAKALRTDVLAIQLPEHPEVRVSISIGLAMMQTDESFNFDKLIQEADLQAHDAKNSGKNCVRIKMKAEQA